MKIALTNLFVGAFIIAITGCAPVKFYSNSGLTQKSGIKYYTEKPYLLIERDPVSNNVLKATILYLPDLENPQYMAIKNGPGSSKVDLKLENGSISTFGFTSDIKLAETIDAIAGLVSKGSAVISDLSTLKGQLPSATSTTVTELYEIFMKNGVTTVKRIEIE